MSESSAAAPALWRHPEFRRGAREARYAQRLSGWLEARYEPMLASSIRRPGLTAGIATAMLAAMATIGTAASDARRKPFLDLKIIDFSSARSVVQG